MKRIPLKDRPLPDYTRGEEIANMTTHILGGALGAAVTVLAVWKAALSDNPYAVVSSAVYGAAMILLFAVSSVYHGLPKCAGKAGMRIIDHCTIYFFIAGTYTPILLTAIRPVDPVAAWSVFAAEWGIAALATVFTAIDLKKFAALSMCCYLGMGWCIVSVLKITVEVLTPSGFFWLLAGGIAYTLGAVLYGIGAKKRYFHSVFHVFVDFGALLQAVCILNYVL